jgi:hypothetical protein
MSSNRTTSGGRITTRSVLVAATLACLGLTAPAVTASATCVLDTDCAAVQCNTVTCQAGTCVYVPADELALCDDGDKCTLGERCLQGVCTPPQNAGSDSDHDGDCDADEITCGCDPNDGAEVCPLPNRLVGRAGNFFGEILITWNTPTVRRVPIATDPSCATAGECTDGRCTRGKIDDLCTTNADCDQPPDTCRVIVNWAAIPDLTLLSSLEGRQPIGGFTVKPGCSRKVDIPVQTGRSTLLRLHARGTVNGRPSGDRDSIRYR